MTDLRHQIQVAKDTVAEKSEDVSALSGSVKRLEHELQETKEFSEKNLAEERGPRLDDNRRLSTTLCAREKDINQLSDNLK